VQYSGVFVCTPVVNERLRVGISRGAVWAHSRCERLAASARLAMLKGVWLLTRCEWVPLRVFISLPCLVARSERR
jgi:hypothetical protein